MSCGLVLEGGAMRGMYTAGVLDVFMEGHIWLDRVVGVSAGALFGVNYLSGQNGRVIRYNKKFNGDKRYMGIRPFLQEGNIISTKYAYEEVPRRLDPFDNETYKQSKIPFHAVITNMHTGQAEYPEIKDVFEQMDTLRASGSMPFVSKPVVINGQKYLDGAIADSIPYQWILQEHCDKAIVVLTRDITYRKKQMNPIAASLGYCAYPQFAKQVKKRHEVYNQEIEGLVDLEQKGKVLVIRPSQPIGINRTESDPDKLQAVYELGRKDAKNLLTKIKEFIK